MEVAVDEALRTVTLRHPTRVLLLRGAALLVLGVALPAWVEATVPALTVPALLATAVAAFWVVQGLTAVLEADEHGITVSASRRGRRVLPWEEVAAVRCADHRIEVVTADGRVIVGPPASPADLERVQRDAATLGLLPHRLR